MKLLVFSDSHGKYSNIQKAVDSHPDASFILHLGDGIQDMESVNTRDVTVYKVNGNYEDCFSLTKKAPSFYKSLYFR